MSYSPSLSSGYTQARNASPFLSPQSGMCSFCTESCNGTCELTLAAVLGAQTVYPMTTGANQIASEKDYPIDYSHFNINGRVFGAVGAEPTYEAANIHNVNLERTYGRLHPVKLALPVVLPALIKLNWKDYFGGAAMAGVSCTIGEDAKSKDPDLVTRNGRVTEFPFLVDILDSFNRYDRGYGQIILQCNVEDDMQGVPEVAIEKYGCKAIEFKFGQSAKGTQPVIRLPDLETAKKRQAGGMIVYPDPSDPAVEQAFADGVCPNFYQYARLPLWDEAYMTRRVAEVRALGAENVTFKMAGYAPADLERVLRLGAAAGVDLITFDGAGGGSGYSPCKMMNEWSLPTVCLEDEVVRICKRLKAEGVEPPAVAVTGGFASEDQVFKALALGDGCVTAVGLCRASMAAAMRGKKIGDQLREGAVPELFRKYGATVEEVFADLPDLRALYGKEANGFSTGAIGVFSYLNKIGFGLRHFAALNRKFGVEHLDRSDLIPLTRDAKDLLEGHWLG